MSYLGIDWKEYSIHDDWSIQGFFGEYRWLSNFHLNPVSYEGLLYPSSEHAYQAAKWPFEIRAKCLAMTAFQAMNWGQSAPVELLEWDHLKDRIMFKIILSKFGDQKLKTKLVETGAKFLSELNHWQDNHWGIDFRTPEKGLNKLGIIIMKVRDIIA